MRVLVTGASGFVGRNLCAALEARDGAEVLAADVGTSPALLDEGLRGADVVFHLAGVNRPQSPDQFDAVNRGLTQELCDALVRSGRRPVFVLASSTQAELDNPYGRSKRAAEGVVRDYCAKTGARGVVHRFRNLFGKWCRPDYNSVTATFCHNIARGLPIEISDPAREIDLTYIDDVVDALVREVEGPGRRAGGFFLSPPLSSHKTTLGALADSIQSFHDHRATLRLPDFGEPFVRALYATYVSYVPPDDLAYGLERRIDARGCLAEFLKSAALGQIFISRTRPGVTRGNHHHRTKAEKFLVVEGEAAVRLRRIGSSDVVEFRVAGEDFRVVDIPPGYTHSIENVGARELVTLFWASEVFDRERPDTLAEDVLREKGQPA